MNVKPEELTVIQNELLEVLQRHKLSYREISDILRDFNYKLGSAFITPDVKFKTAHGLAVDKIDKDISSF